MPDQTGWAFETFCTTGCAQTGSGNSTSASCNPLVCAPLTRVCEADGVTVDTCNQTGTAYAETDTCPQGCQDGQCITTSANCNVGDERCNGLDTQACTAVPNESNVTTWSVTGTCLTGCSSGACLPGGSCASLSLETGAPLDGGVPAAPGDGVSTVLVYSDPILDETGAKIPDGTLFTVNAVVLGGAADGGPQPIALPTADADSATPGTQVASSNGRIRFTVPTTLLAAGQSASVQITAQLEQGGSCAASQALTLNANPPLPNTVLVAEDFSTTSFRDPSFTTANWSTTQQQLSGAWPDAIGNGGDGSPR